MPHRIATLALAPVLLWQGKHVRRVVPRLEEPTGPRRGARGEGPPLRLLIVGDSAAAGVGTNTQANALTGQVSVALAASFQVTYRLEARTGRTTNDCITALEADRGDDRYDVALTSLGVNDATALCSPRRFDARQRRLLAVLRARYGVRHIVITLLPPVGRFPALPWPLRPVIGGYATALNGAVVSLCDDVHDCTALDLNTTTDLGMSDMASDGFHPGPTVYAEWGRRAADCITALHARGALEGDALEGTPPGGA